MTCDLKKANANDEGVATVTDENIISGWKNCAHKCKKTQIDYGSIKVPLIKDDYLKRIVVIGGDADNKRIWISNSNGQVWRKSIKLPYNGNTVYHPTLVEMDDR